MAPYNTKRSNSRALIRVFVVPQKLQNVFPHTALVENLEYNLQQCGIQQIYV